MSFSRLKSMSSRRSTPQIIQNQTGSPFLNLPEELRVQIYEEAFNRTPAEKLQALQNGPSANSASGLTFACRQLREETKVYYQADSVTNLWPWLAQDAMPTSVDLFSENQGIKAWLKGRNGLALRHRPQSVKELSWQISLVRNTLSQSEHFLDMPVFASSQLKPTDIYIRVCLCDSISWLHESPSHVMTFCIALESVAMKFASLERIHILYCGKDWPGFVRSNGPIDFPGIALGRHQVRMQSGSNWSIEKVDESKMGWAPKIGRHDGQVQSPPGARMSEDEESMQEKSDLCKSRTEMKWNNTQAHPGQATQQVPWKDRTVAIDYYDSKTLCGEECVRIKRKAKAPAASGPPTDPKQASVGVKEKVKETKKHVYLSNSPWTRRMRKIKDKIEGVEVRQPFLPKYDPDGEVDRYGRFK